MAASLEHMQIPPTAQQPHLQQGGIHGMSHHHHHHQQQQNSLTTSVVRGIPGNNNNNMSNAPTAAATASTSSSDHSSPTRTTTPPQSATNTPTRRRRKKRVEREIPRTEEDIEREKLLEDDDVRSPHKVFVGGLGHNTTGATLRSYFEQFGEVALCAVVRHRRSGRSRGFAFVSFVDTAVAESVAGGRHVIDGVAVECRRALPRSETRKVPPADCVPHPTKVFVGGLPDGVTEEELLEFCKAFGPVESVNVAFDKQTHRPRGFGFVVFSDERSLETAVGFHEFCGKIIEVKAAVPRDPTEQLNASTSLPQLPTALNLSMLGSAVGHCETDLWWGGTSGSLSTAASLFQKTATVPGMLESPPGLSIGNYPSTGSNGGGFTDLHFNSVRTATGLGGNLGLEPSLEALRTGSLDAAFNQFLGNAQNDLKGTDFTSNLSYLLAGFGGSSVVGGVVLGSHEILGPQGSYTGSIANHQHHQTNNNNQQGGGGGVLGPQGSMDFFSNALDSQHSVVSMENNNSKSSNSNNRNNSPVGGNMAAGMVEPWKRLAASSGLSTATSYGVGTTAAGGALVPDSPSTTCTTQDFGTVDSPLSTSNQQQQ